VNTYLFALGVTLVVEMLIVAALFRGQRIRMVLVCALATTATHLSMHFVLPQFFSTHRYVVIVGEALALVVEALAYGALAHPRDWPRALIVSALANSASYGAGFVINFIVRH
jgi:hypothetical protein